MSVLRHRANFYTTLRLGCEVIVDSALKCNEGFFEDFVWRAVFERFSWSIIRTMTEAGRGILAEKIASFRSQWRVAGFWSGDMLRFRWVKNRDTGR